MDEDFDDEPSYKPTGPQKTVNEYAQLGIIAVRASIDL